MNQQVLNSLVYRLKNGVRYKDIPKGEGYAAKSTVYYWLGRWSEAGVLDAVWKRLLGLLEAEGKLDLTEGSINGSFLPSKRGRRDRAFAQGQRLDAHGSERSKRLTRRVSGRGCQYA